MAQLTAQVISYDEEFKRQIARLVRACGVPVGMVEGRSADVTVDTVMTRNVATIDTHADIADAAATMMKRRVRRLPVVDERGHVHGVVTLDDMLRDMGRQADEMSEVLLSQSSSLSHET